MTNHNKNQLTALGKQQKRTLFVEVLEHLEKKGVENVAVARSIRDLLIKQGNPVPKMNDRRIRNIKDRTFVQDEELNAVFTLYSGQLKTFTTTLLPSVEVPQGAISEEEKQEIIEKYERKIAEYKETIEQVKKIINQLGEE